MELDEDSPVEELDVNSLVEELDPDSIYEEIDADSEVEGLCDAEVLDVETKLRDDSIDEVVEAVEAFTAPVNRRSRVIGDHCTHRL